MVDTAINRSSGVITLTAKADVFGSEDITVTATSDQYNINEEVTATFTVVVNNVNDAPTVANEIDDNNSPGHNEDAAFTLDITSNFQDLADGDTLSFSVSGYPQHYLYPVEKLSVHQQMMM